MIPSKLILQSGETFSGLSPEWQKEHFFGEVVFTTGMTGYVESLTDPSYAGQILSFCYPLIGNYGVPDKTLWESKNIQVSGVIVGTIDSSSDHWNASQNFLDWLKSENIPLITNIDTRALTKLLRKQGTVLGAIARDPLPHFFPDPNKTNLIAKVSCKTISSLKNGIKRVIAIDCGMKENIMRSLSSYPLEIVRVPYDYDYSEDPFDALFISNGPGDPLQAQATIAILRKALAKEKPTFGICLGAQLMALAIGAKTYKLPFGHRGQNQPCLDLLEDRAILTSQNHGYAIEAKSLPEDWEVTFTNLNDGSVEGIKHKTLPFFSVQFHPESCPGPTDGSYLFNKFYELI